MRGLRFHHRPSSPPAAILLLGLLLAAPDARAVRIRIDARSGVLAYPVIGPDGRVVLDRRLVQSRLLLRLDDLLPVEPATADPAEAPDVSLACSLRWFADPGIATVALDPGDLRFVPGFDDAGLDVLFAWVEATNLFDGWFGARLGRLVVDGPLGFRSDDGVWLEFSPLDEVGVRVTGGFENVRGLRLSASPFAPGGVERWSAEGEGAGRYGDAREPEHRPTVGAELFGRIGPVGYDAAYRRTWRSVDGGFAEELVGIETNLEIPPVFAWGAARVDLLIRNVASAEGEVSVRLGRDGRHRIEARYEYFRPTFDAESIFWVFSSEPFHEGTLRYRFPLQGALSGETWFSARFTQGLRPEDRLAGPFTDFGGGLGLRLETESFVGAMRWKMLEGGGSSLAGADLSVEVPLVDCLAVYAVASAWRYADRIREGRHGVGGAGRLGAAVEVVRGVEVEVEAQAAHDTREGTTFAVFAWLDLGVSL